MANLDSFLPSDSHTPYKPPYFDGTNYGHWKQRMQTYIEATDLFMWVVIVIGLDVLARAPTQQIGETNNQLWLLLLLL